MCNHPGRAVIFARPYLYNVLKHAMESIQDSVAVTEVDFGVYG
jgi:hypothetical protein